MGAKAPPAAARLSCAAWLSLLVTTRAALVNALAVHVALQLVLFQHFFYTAFTTLAVARAQATAAGMALRRELITWAPAAPAPAPGEPVTPAAADYFADRNMYIRAVEFALMMPTMWNLAVMLLSVCKYVSRFGTSPAEECAPLTRSRVRCAKRLTPSPSRLDARGADGRAPLSDGMGALLSLRRCCVGSHILGLLAARADLRRLLPLHWPCGAPLPRSPRRHRTGKLLLG
jgi:hypothetical protein